MCSATRLLGLCLLLPGAPAGDLPCAAGDVSGESVCYQRDRACVASPRDGPDDAGDGSALLQKPPRGRPPLEPALAHPPAIVAVTSGRRPRLGAGQPRHQTKRACIAIIAILADEAPGSPWEMVCGVESLRRKMALLTGGCLLMPSRGAIDDLFRVFGDRQIRPSGTAWVEIFDDAFFPGECPIFQEGRMKTSLGNITGIGCDSGIRSRNGACIKATLLGSTGPPLNVTVYKLQGFFSIPRPWEQAMTGEFKHQKMDPTATTTTRYVNPSWKAGAKTKASPKPKIPLQFILCGRNGSAALGIAEKTLKLQIKALNRGFAGNDKCQQGEGDSPPYLWYKTKKVTVRIDTLFRFRKVKTQVRVDEGCSTDCYGMAYDLATSLLAEEAGTIKVMVCDLGYYLGVVGFVPRQGGGFTRTLFIDTTTLPGGEPPYNLGDTLTHEMGHYLSLKHTFINGCTTPGDEVEDTNQEQSPLFGCTNVRPQDAPRTCDPGAGPDPAHNFMDYTDDACMCGFTVGQRERLLSQAKANDPDLYSIICENESTVWYDNGSSRCDV